MKALGQMHPMMQIVFIVRAPVYSRVRFGLLSKAVRKHHNTHYNWTSVPHGSGKYLKLGLVPSFRTFVTRNTTAFIGSYGHKDKDFDLRP